MAKHCSAATLRLGCCDLLQESLLRLLLLLQTLSPTLPLLKAYHTYYTTLPHLLHTYCLIHTYYTLLRLLLQTLSYSHTTKSSKVHTSIVHYCSFELEQVRQPTYFCLLLPHLRQCQTTTHTEPATQPATHYYLPVYLPSPNLANPAWL